MITTRLAFLTILGVFIQNVNNLLIEASMGRTCTTPIGEQGTCISLKDCPEVLVIFQKLPLRQASTYSQALRRNCDNAVTHDNYPLVCCLNVMSVARDASEPPSPTEQSPTEPFPTKPSPPTESTTRTEAQVTSKNDKEINSRKSETSSGPNCRTPDNAVGHCQQLQECDIIRDSLLRNPLNEEMKQMVRDSNKICNSVKFEICCPQRQLIPNEDDGCGVAEQKNFKVYGGEETAIGAWPWMVLLGYDKWTYNPFRCGGSLISRKHVLTAAHCINHSKPTFVRLGEHDLSIDNETQHIDIDIEKMVSHANFGPDKRNDIGLVFLQELVQFTARIAPICLPMADRIRTKSYVNSRPFVAGWGRTEGGSASHVLLQAEIPILKNSMCHNIYANLNRLVSQNQFDESVICAGVLSGGIDTCQGDSGGPLMVAEVYKGSRRYYALGIVSYGIKCAEPGKPGVYTDVRYFLDWIMDNISN